MADLVVGGALTLTYFETLERLAPPAPISAVDQPYLPLLAAIEKGIITSSEIERLAQLEEELRIGETLANGLLPNGGNAGIVVDRDGMTVEYDHVRLKVEGNDILIHPTPKADVTDRGKVVDIGVVMRGTLEGDFVPVAAAVDTITQFATAARLTRRERFTNNRIAMFLTGTLDNLPPIEARDVLPSGVIVGAFKRRFFSAGSPTTR